MQLNESVTSKSNSVDSIPHWEWTNCLFDLKRELKKKIEYLNLAPQASFFLDNQVLTFQKNI